MSELTKVASKSELTEGKGKCVEVNGQRIAVFLVDGVLYAIGDTCTHEGGPLSEGELDGTEVECPWHGACFDLTSGECLAPPADDDVTGYEVTTDGDDVKIRL